MRTFINISKKTIGISPKNWRKADVGFYISNYLALKAIWVPILKELNECP